MAMFESQFNGAAAALSGGGFMPSQSTTQYADPSFVFPAGDQGLSISLSDSIPRGFAIDTRVLLPPESGCGWNGELGFLKNRTEIYGCGEDLRGFYKLQSNCLQRDFQEVLNSEEGKDLFINIVGAFQGQECDVIIMSCVRRMKADVSRARRTLRTDDWAAPNADAKARNCYLDMDSVPKEFFIPRRANPRSPARKTPLNSRVLRSSGSRHRLMDVHVEPRSAMAPEDDKNLPAPSIPRNGNFQPLKPPVENSSVAVDQMVTDPRVSSQIRRTEEAAEFLWTNVEERDY